MNQNTCITIDVSQNKSHIQGFIGPNKPLSKARTMRNTKQGFQFILILKNLFCLYILNTDRNEWVNIHEE